MLAVRQNQPNNKIKKLKKKRVHYKSVEGTALIKFCLGGGTVLTDYQDVPMQVLSCLFYQSWCREHVLEA